MPKKKARSKDVIFVTSFRHPSTGRIIRAADYGLRAFPIRRKPARARKKAPRRRR